MTQEKSLTLQLEPQQLDSFCQKITARSRNTAAIHEALNVLEAFVSAFSRDSQGSDNYRIIQETLKSYSEQTREKLMQEKTRNLLQGLLEQNITELVNVYTTLSRNGFYQILSRAVESLSSDKTAMIAQWVSNWSAAAKEQAEQASGYPDALDFNKAGINIEHYQAMADTANFFHQR